MVAIPGPLPFAPLQWSPIGPGREEARVEAELDPTYGVLSTELGSDGVHAILQFEQSIDCAGETYHFKRLVDLASGETVGAYATRGDCGSGQLAPESALTGGVLSWNISTGATYLLLGSRRVDEQTWSWWPESMLLTEVVKIHDLADGTLVLRTGGSLRVALDRRSSALTPIDDTSVGGAAGDDVFVWTKLLSPSGSLVRSWSREGGVKDVATLPDDSCLVAATASEFVGVMGRGRCTGFLQGVRFWRLPRDAPAGSVPVIGPRIESIDRLSVLKLVATDEFLAFHGTEDSDDDDREFIVILRRSDETLWRVDRRAGRSLGGHAGFTITPSHLFLLERAATNWLVLISVHRLALDSLEDFATPL